MSYIYNTSVTFHKGNDWIVDIDEKYLYLFFNEDNAHDFMILPEKIYIYRDCPECGFKSKEVDTPIDAVKIIEDVEVPEIQAQKEEVKIEEPRATLEEKESERAKQREILNKGLQSK